MDEQWPPPGHQSYYQMEARFEGVIPIVLSLQVTVPASRSGAGVDLATLRLARLRGPTSGDTAFREDLYPRIGAVTVAGGHVEAAMKRVLLIAEQRPGDFEVVDLTWSALVKRLKRIVRAGSWPLAARLAEHLAWAEAQGVKQRRDDVVHAYWWHFDGVGVSRSRFRRDGSSSIIRSNFENLDEDAALLFEFAERLDDLVVSDWPQGRLPAAD